MLGLRKRKLERHVRSLCQQHDITFTIKKGRGFAKVKSRSIQIPPIREDMDYFVSLHEVGHVIIGLTNPYRLEREARAWTWALENTVVEPSYDVRQRICALLVRYWFRAKSNNWKIPESGEFWDNMKWW